MEISHPLSGGAVRRSLTSPADFALTRRKWAPHLVIGVIAALLGLIAFALGHFTAFYSVDGDIKYLGAWNIAQHFSNGAIRYPGSHLGPHGLYSLPLTAWYSGHDYAGYSLGFLYISAVALKLFGVAGLVLPPIGGTVVLLYAQLKLADLLNLKSSRIVLLIATAAATPILFYSVSFWEHSWGVGLFLAGVAVLLASLTDKSAGYWQAAAAGVLLFGAALMRRETLIPALILLVAAPIFFRRSDVLIKTGAAAALLLVPIGLILLYHPEPLAVGLTHASPGRGAIGVRSGLSKVTKLEFLLTGGWATGVLFGFTVVLVGLRFWKPRLVVPVMAAGSLLCGLALVFSMLSRYTFSNENIVAFCPLVIWGLLMPVVPATDDDADTGTSWLLWGLAILGILAVVVSAGDSGGAQWGPRYLLFAFPLLVLLALVGRERMLAVANCPKRLVNYAFVGVFALSVLVQGLGLFALTVKQDLAAKADAAIARTHVHTVVSAFPVIDVLAPTYEENRDLYAPDQKYLVGLMAKLRIDGTKRVVMLCDTVDPCTWQGYQGWHHGSIRRVPHMIRYTVFTLS